jgi:hypothetical protein
MLQRLSSFALRYFGRWSVNSSGPKGTKTGDKKSITLVLS